MISLFRVSLITIIITLCSIYSFSQDLIITYDNDSVFCKIVEKKSDYIKFKTDTSENASTSKINMQFVKKHYFDYYIERENVIVNNENYNPKVFPFHLSFDLGYSHRIARSPSTTDIGISDYYKEIKSGIAFSVDLSFCQLNSIGGGIKYSIHNSKANLSSMTLDLEDGTSLIGSVSDNIKIHSFGPFITSRNSLNTNNGSYFFNFGGNVYIYQNEAEFIYPFLLEGNAYGFVLESGIDFDIGQFAAVGFKLSIYSGVMKSVVMTSQTDSQRITLEEKDFENLSRIDLTIGLRFF